MDNKPDSENAPLEDNCMYEPRQVEQMEASLGRQHACDLVDCRHRQKLKETLIDAVEVLEKTKKSFKSKQLELLRKKFLRVLMEEL